MKCVLRTSFTAFILLLLTSAMLVGPTWAQGKSGKDGDGGGGKPRDDVGPALKAGTIFFRVGEQAYRVKSDGSGEFAALPFGYWGTPSHLRYGADGDEHRWWLEVVDYGDTDPDGNKYTYIDALGSEYETNRTELFAFRADASSPTGVSYVQLTDFYPHVKIGVGTGHQPKWSNDGADSFVGFKGVHYTAYPIADYVILYRLNLSASLIEVAFDIGVAPAIPVDSDLVEEAVTTSSGFEGNYTQHEWSPPAAGDQVVYELDPNPTVDSTSELYITNISTGTTQLLADMTSVSGPNVISWSPDGSKVFWGDSRDIGMINADGTAQGLFLDGDFYAGYSSPFWSLDGQHVVCSVSRYSSKKGGQWRTTFVLTALADGNPIDIPTSFDSLSPNIRLLGWVSDDISP